MGGTPRCLLHCELLQIGWQKISFECLTGKHCSQIQSESDVLNNLLHFISYCKLLSTTQLSCKHVPAVGMEKPSPFTISLSTWKQSLIKSLPACPIWACVLACFITSAWCYWEQRSLLAAGLYCYCCIGCLYSNPISCSRNICCFNSSWSLTNTLWILIL